MTIISRFALIAGAAIIGLASPAYAAHGPRHHNISTQWSGLNAFAMVPNLQGRGAYDPALTGGGSIGYNANFRRDDW